MVSNDMTIVLIQTLTLEHQWKERTEIIGAEPEPSVIFPSVCHQTLDQNKDVLVVSDSEESGATQTGV